MRRLTKAPTKIKKAWQDEEEPRVRCGFFLIPLPFHILLIMLNHLGLMIDTFNLRNSRKRQELYFIGEIRNIKQKTLAGLAAVK